jgi:sorbitol/mannitol transport system permease protein
MARAASPRRKIAFTLAAWAVGLTIFFPVLWTVLTSFKTEASAVASPPEFLNADWTLENYAEVWARSDYPRFFWNSVVISIGSTLLGLAIAIPAAWSMAFVPGRRTKDLLMWMLSTKMMPAVGVLIPMYLIFQRTGLFDTRFGLILALMLMNLPIIVWMLYTYFKEIPGEILERRGWTGRRCATRSSTCWRPWRCRGSPRRCF